LEARHGIPVFGALEEISRIRAVVRNLPSGSTPSEDLCNALGDELYRYFHLDKMLELAGRRPMCAGRRGLFSQRQFDGPLHVAVAYDEAFSCYFPDSLDLLESRGADVSVFSPLRGDSLPAGTDVVYIGCGRIDEHLPALSDNFCIKEAIWDHVLSGKRVYAEGAGLAYLGREVRMPCGRRFPMVGLFPLIASKNLEPARARPVEVTTAMGSWMFPASERVRGYLNSKWKLESDGSLASLVADDGLRDCLVGDYRVVGSRLHLNFAALPQFMGNFFRPCSESRPRSGSLH
jgi:cobyrinic acid a,c-diamide synthase